MNWINLETSEPAMQHLFWVALLTDLIPLWRVRRYTLSTSLSHAFHWAILAWLGWLFLAVAAVAFPPSLEAPLTYTSLCLSGNAGIAVLGARRPGVQAWNFVLAGLLAVLLLPLLEGLELRSAPIRKLFLGVVVLVPLLNYLPTRMWFGVVLFAVPCGVEFLRLGGPAAWRYDLDRIHDWSRLILAFSPWGAWLSLTRKRSALDRSDALWLEFRDAYGFVWGQRVREQFNRSCANSGLPVTLSWWGMRYASPADAQDTATRDRVLQTLRSLVKRFGSEEVGEEAART